VATSAVAVDASNGDVVIGGRFGGTVDLGTGPLMAQGNYPSLFVAKYDCTGKPLWSKGLGTPVTTDDQLWSIAIDPQAHATLLAGTYGDSIDFGCGAIVSPGSNGFVAKLDASGACVFGKRFGGADMNSDESNVGYGVVSDTSGNVLVAGNYRGITNFGGGTVMSDGAGTETTQFLLELGPTGSFGWLKQYGTGGWRFKMARDAAGNVLLCGDTVSTGLDFGGGPLPQNAIYLAKLDANGAFVWAKAAATNGAQPCTSLTADASGNLLFGGWYSGTPPSFGGAPLPVGGNTAVGGYVAKFSAAGTYVFSQGNTAVAGQTYVYGVAADASSDLVFTGTCNNQPFSFGGPPQTPSGSIFVAKVDPTGVLASSKFFNAGDSHGIAVAPSGMLVLGGSYGGTVDFGNGPLPMAPMGAAFVAQIAP
jgi:hypothetical protein